MSNTPDRDRARGFELGIASTGAPTRHGTTFAMSSGDDVPWRTHAGIRRRLCRAASHLLLRAFSIALATAATCLVLNAAAAGVSRVVSGATAEAGLPSPVGWTPTATRSLGHLLPTVIPAVGAAPCQENSAPATRGISLTPI